MHALLIVVDNGPQMRSITPARRKRGSAGEAVDAEDSMEVLTDDASSGRETVHLAARTAERLAAFCGEFCGSESVGGDARTVSSLVVPKNERRLRLLVSGKAHSIGNTDVDAGASLGTTDIWEWQRACQREGAGKIPTSKCRFLHLPP